MNSSRIDQNRMCTLKISIEEMTIEDKIMFNIIDNVDLNISDELYYALRREIGLIGGSRKTEIQDFLHLLGHQLLSIDVSTVE